MIIGIDVGGTHTDGVLIKSRDTLDSGEEYEVIATSKVNTERDNLMKSILNALDKLIMEGNYTGVKRIVLSTTLAANTILEEKYDPVGLILISGPGLNPQSLFYGEENLLLSGYINHRGKQVKGIDQENLISGLDMMKSRNIKNLAIVGKFSIRNPEQEKEIVKIIKDKKYPFENISVGHQLSGRLSFPRRVLTTYFNSAIMSIYKDFSAAVKKALQGRGLKTEVLILKCDGGTIPLGKVMEAPIKTVNSGPAASIMGTMAMSKSSLEDITAIVLDIGGTTTDIGLFINGDPAFMPEGIEIDGLPTLVRGLYSLSIPLGGDSKISVVDGKLRIGPEREGPAVAFGGTVPTPTDVLLVLGHLQNDPVYVEKADSAAAREALTLLARKVEPIEYRDYYQNGKIELRSFAQLIIDLVLGKITSTIQEILSKLEKQPVYTISELLAAAKIRPQLLLTMGGPANALSPLLAEKLAYNEIVVPYAKIANAIGAALAIPTVETTVRVDTASSYLDIVEAGIHRKLDQKERYNLEEVKELAIIWTRKRAGDNKASVEITDSESFNVIKGFRTIGKIMEVKAQIKPGLISGLEGSGQG